MSRLGTPPFVTAELAWRALFDAFSKLAPQRMLRRPVVFAVEARSSPRRSVSTTRTAAAYGLGVDVLIDLDLVLAALGWA